MDLLISDTAVDETCFFLNANLNPILFLDNLFDILTRKKTKEGRKKCNFWILIFDSSKRKDEGNTVKDEERKLIYDGEYFPFQYSWNEFQNVLFFFCLYVFSVSMFFFFIDRYVFFAVAKKKKKLILTRDFSCDDALDSYFLLRLVQNAKLICKLTPFCILIRGTLPKDIVRQKKKKRSPKILLPCITKQQAITKNFKGWRKSGREGEIKKKEEQAAWKCEM